MKLVRDRHGLLVYRFIHVFQKDIRKLDGFIWLMFRFESSACHNIVIFATLCIVTLKRKSFATLLKCKFLLIDPKISFGDITVDKSSSLPCIQHENQNAAAYENVKHSRLPIV